MTASKIRELCRNLTALLEGRDLEKSLLNSTAPDRAAFIEERDRHALLYIVVVLLFYSIGIIIAIVMYLKRERDEIEEEAAYDQYMNFRADPGKASRMFRVQKMIEFLQGVDKERELKREASRKRREAARVAGAEAAGTAEGQELAAVVVEREGEKKSVSRQSSRASGFLKSSSASKLFKSPSWGSNKSQPTRSSRSPSRKSFGRSRSTSPRPESIPEHENLLGERADCSPLQPSLSGVGPSIEASAVQPSTSPVQPSSSPMETTTIESQAPSTSRQPSIIHAVKVSSADKASTSPVKSTSASSQPSTGPDQGSLLPHTAVKYATSTEQPSTISPSTATNLTTSTTGITCTATFTTVTNATAESTPTTTTTVQPSATADPPLKGQERVEHIKTPSVDT